MKRIFYELITISFVIALSGCSSPPAATPTPVAPTATPTAAPTAAPTPTPVPSATPVTIPDTVVYTGSGDDVIELEAFDGVYIFYIEGNADSRHFAVKGYDQNNKSTGLFVNTTKSYSGITIDPDQETVTMEITAKGKWTIEVRSVFTARTISAGETVEGTGDEVLLVLSSGKTATIVGNNEKHHFAVKSYGSTSNNLMVNTTDPYDGNVMLKGDPILLEIDSEGEWSITFN